MSKRWIALWAGLLLIGLSRAFPQRTYEPHSVLANGSWYQLAIRGPGVYKIDLPFLASLGVNTSNISSTSIRLFGNGGYPLAEANNGTWTDDLRENAIQVVDGGDGILNGNDYFLFNATGPVEWINDPANLRFLHRQHPYTDQSIYFLSIGGNGKRINNAAPGSFAPVTVTSYSARFVHELDSVNFLSGSREWYGEELSDLPGRSLTRHFSVSIPNLLANAQVIIQSNAVARSIGTASRFDVRLNNQPVGQLTANATNGGPYDLFAQPATGVQSTTISQSALTLSYSFIPGSFNAQGWINWFEIYTRAALSMSGINQLLFRDWQSVGNSSAAFVVSNAPAALQVWEVTDPFNPLQMSGTLSGTDYRFVNDALQLREYIAFTGINAPAPIAIGRIDNQDLHQTGPTDMVIVCYPLFRTQAERLAEIHRTHDAMRIKVVTTSEVFNEFSSGAPDPTAIRDYVKMFYDKYNSNPADHLKYLLLFGDASFDYKNRIAGNTNFVPAWQSPYALDPLSSYPSDDYFGFLDDQEDINSGLVTNLLDIGIGRIPASTIEQAKNVVDKLAAYLSPTSLGPWRNNFTFIADDEDNNLHVQDAETITTTAATIAPVFTLQKIYLDAYRQEAGAGGASYPQANQASNNKVLNGTLIWNYNGHGGYNRLAEETVLDQSIVNSWDNANRLPLFITATCDFAPYDNPRLASLGENILLRPKTGAIALLTTTRIVFAFSNRIINDNYMRVALQQGADGLYPRLGDALRDAKNLTYQGSGDITNNRKFTLLGDPALRLNYPVHRARVTFVNGIPATTADTLRATEKIRIEGEVTDLNGNLLTGFNGSVYPVLFDKPQTITTLSNDPGSPATSFQVQSNALFKGKATITNGKFSFECKMPKDINFQYGNGKLALYAENGAQDANGFFTNLIIGGLGSGSGNDREGPTIRAYLNDELFVNGSLTNQQPVLLVKLSDTSGINTAGTGIGHELLATLDNDNRRYFILNDYYQSAIDNYREGSIRFQLPVLEPGPHSLKIKAWDVLNNSSEYILDFVVGKDEEIVLSHVLNYPNPFTSHTGFWFEHNKPGQVLSVQVEIMTITGRLVKTIRENVVTEGNRSATIEWDGRDDYGDRLGRGVYLYKLRVTAPGKMKKEVLEKLVIL